MMISVIPAVPEGVDKQLRPGRIVAFVLVVIAVIIASVFLVSSRSSVRLDSPLLNQESPPPASDDTSPTAPQPVDFYTTNFPLTERPISERKVWVSGKTAGQDWEDVATSSGKAFGTQRGSASGAAVYADSTAVLNGTFGPDQEASATVFNNDAGGDWNGEVELRLRTTITPRSITGYEIEFRARTGASAYCDLVRWNGALGDFTPLLHIEGSQCGVATGDVIRATMIGTTLTAYKNDTMVMQASDSTFSTGNPGIGFFLHNNRASGDAANFGFTSFTTRTISEDSATGY